MQLTLWLACVAEQTDPSDALDRRGPRAEVLEAPLPDTAWLEPLREGPFTVDGRQGWQHDEGNEIGLFHTYDAFDLGPGRPRHKVHVYLPRSALRGGGPYPLVVMHDGDTAFWPGGLAGKTWDADGTVDALVSTGVVPEPIVVAIVPVVRDAEYTHTDGFFGLVPCCELPEWSDTLAEELLPWIAGRYPVTTDHDRWLVVGSSHGGLAAFWSAVTHPETYGGGAALSSSFWVGLDVPGTGLSLGELSDSELLDVARPTLEDRELRPRLWIDWGLRRTAGVHDSEIERLATERGEEMVDLLELEFDYRKQIFDAPGVETDADLMVHVDPIGGHDEDAWAWRFRLLLEAFFSE